MFVLAGQARTGATYLAFLSNGTRIDFPSAPNQAGGLLKFSGSQYGVGNARVFNSTSSVSAGQSAATFVWADAGLPGTNLVDPFGAGNTGTATGFFGFSFSSTGGQRNQGWGQIQITAAGGLPQSFTIIDYAYQNDGSAIHVPDSGKAIPEPGVLGLLALACGASGMRRYRKEKKAA